MFTVTQYDSDCLPLKLAQHEKPLKCSIKFNLLFLLKNTVCKMLYLKKIIVLHFLFATRPQWIIDKDIFPLLFVFFLFLFFYAHFFSSFPFSVILLKNNPFVPSSNLRNFWEYDEKRDTFRDEKRPINRYPFLC